MDQVDQAEKAQWTEQLAAELPPELLRQARDFLRQERPDMTREQVEREAIASVRAWQTKRQPAVAPVSTDGKRTLRRGGGDITPIMVFAAKRNGVIE